MSIWNKILLGLIAFASLGFFHAAARTVKTYQYWANQTDTFEKKLTEVRQDVASLQTGNLDLKNPRVDKTIGVQQLRIDLGRELANRGRIWTKWEKKKVATLPSGLMEVGVSSDDSAGIAKNMLLYAFEEGDDQSPGKYLGEFRVEGVSQNQLDLHSTTQMVASLAKNVTESKGTWVLYETIPTDEHEVFANLTEDQKKGIPDELLKDGRPLRDYLAIFRACEVHRTLFLDRWESATRDLRYLKIASDEADTQVDLAEKEKAQVAKELNRAKTELSAVASLNASRQNMLKVFQTGVQTAIATNLKYAQEIARLQKDAADLIDRRMRAMAQFGPRTD